MTRPKPTARGSAARVLRNVERREGFSNRLLAEHLEAYPELDRRDRGLITTLVYGVLRHRARLDHLIDHAARDPAGLRGHVRHVLRIGAFEMRELDRPAHVAISEAQHAVRELDPRGGLAPVVQAILSSVDRDGQALDDAAAASRPLDALERRWSIPRWLAGRWLKQLGPDAAVRRAQAVAAVPPVDLRVDLSRIDRDRVATRLRENHPGIEISTLPDQPQALRTRGGSDLFYGPLHDAGLISVQGLGSQQAARLLDPRPGERILDACAGMGTKTLQLAELMQRRGTLVAIDASPQRLDAHRELARRGSIDAEGLELTASVGDLTQTLPEVDEAPFDAVLLDAPCTGLGNLARHPEIRWRAQFSDIAACADLQRRLLSRCLLRVRPGGRLVYAVCSLEPEEGPAIVGEIPAHEATVAEERTYTPEDDGTDGFYCALVVRSSDAGP